MLLNVCQQHTTQNYLRSINRCKVSGPISEKTKKSILGIHQAPMGVRMDDELNRVCPLQIS